MTLSGMRRNVIALLSLGLGALSSSGAEPLATNVRFDCGPPGHPHASVRIEQLAPKAKRLGFVRVAAVPGLAASGIEIRVRKPDPSLFADLAQNLQIIAPSKHLELERLAIFIGQEPQPRISARAGSLQETQWTLTHIVIALPSGPRTLPSATIQSGTKGLTLSSPNKSPIDLVKLFGQND
jgi:hypothetical protein